MIDCIEYADAPFCAGESLKECPQGTEVPETVSCGTDGLGGNVDALGVPDDEFYSCEETGECDDSCSPPAREDCTLPTAEVAVPPTPVEEQLPQTGITDPGLLFATALALVVAGLRLRRLS